MRLSLVTLSAATLALTVTSAFADDLFTLVGNGGTTISFTEPATPDISPYNAAPDYFYFQGIPDANGNRFNLPYTVDGQPQLTDEIDFFNTTGGGGLAIDDNGGGQNFVELAGPTLFSGTTSNPTFLLGTFDLTSPFPTCNGTPYQGYCVDNSEDYTLTISNGSAAVTPEPASLALLGTGLLGGLATIRRRFTRV